MKFFVCIALIAATASYVAAGPAVAASSNSGSASVGVNAESEAEGQQGVQQAAIQQAIDLTRLRKSAYGGGSSGGGYGGQASIPAPPCPKNYLFSCQPNLAPVACSAPAASYGSAGAYSAPVPTYVSPLARNIGVGVGIPQPIGYNPQQYYQY